MGSRLNMVRVRKELLINRVCEQARDKALVAVASMGSLGSADKFKLRYGLEKAGATVNFSKNTLMAKGLGELGADTQSLVPLLRGKTLLACGPAEVPLAKQLLAFEKTLPGFYVLGALLNSTRILQARAPPTASSSALRIHLPACSRYRVARATFGRRCRR